MKPRKLKNAKPGSSSQTNDEKPISATQRRAERRKQLQLRAQRYNSKSAFLEFVLPVIFSAHWLSFVFWPALGVLWGVAAEGHGIAINAPLFGALLGGGVALVFYLIESNSPYLLATCYGLSGGLAYGVFANPPDTLLYMLTGSILALLGRPLINYFPFYLS